MTPNHASSPNTSHPPVSPERQRAEDPFAFIDPTNIQELRYEQYRFVSEEEGKFHPRNEKGRQLARERAFAHMDDLRHEYLKDMGVKLDKNDPIYKEYLRWVTNVSIDNMDETAWRIGTVDAEGKHVPGGREMIADLHDAKLDDYKRSSISYRLNGGSSLSAESVQQLDPDSQGVVAQVNQLVKDTQDQMSALAKKADDIRARSQSLLSADATQPVGLSPDMQPPDPDQTQSVSTDPDAKTTVSREMIASLDVDRNNEIQAAFNRLYAARERLATLVKGNKNTLEYQNAQQEWAHSMAEYGRLQELRLQFLNPNRTHEDFVRDATWYAIDQISRLDTLAEQKKDELLRRKFINAFKKNKVVQSVIMGAAFGVASLAQKKDPIAAAGAALAGAIVAPKLIEGTNAIVNGRNAQPYTSFSPDFLRANIKYSEKGDIHAAARFLGERFTQSEKERRKKAGRKAVLGGLATTVALISTSMLPEHIDWQNISGTETIDGTPFGHDTSATRPDHSPFDIEGKKGEEPEQPPQPPENPTNPKPPEIPPIFTPEVLTQGVNVPLEWGDGALAVGERLGLNPDQQQRFLELLSERHDGSTYMGPDGVRLYFNGGALHLSPTDLLKIFNP